MKNVFIAFIVAIVPALAAVVMAKAEEPLVFRGACDGSGTVAISERCFLSASDEDNVLRVYDAKTAGAPIATVDLEQMFSLTTRKEMDLESATQIGDTLFFLSSHKRSKKGKAKIGYLMGLKVGLDAKGKWVASKVGNCYQQLTEALVADVPELARVAMNIEGLSVWKGEQLLIGFRNLSADGKALFVPLTNPFAVVQSNERPVFGKPIRLNLEGQGVRALEFIPERSLYAIVAGSENAHGQFRFFTWSGDIHTAPGTGPVLNIDAESIVVFPGEKKRLLLLSDDSGELSDGVSDTKCRDLPSGDLDRTFRGQWLSF